MKRLLGLLRRASLGAEIDLRSLGVFRIAIGSVLLVDLADRSRDLVSLYTDFGPSPATLVRELHGDAVLLSLHYHASGSVVAQGLLMGVGMAAALAFLLGYRTRAATILSWVLLVSLQIRNPEVSFSGADKLLRLMLFFGMLLPLGARFSIDARAGRGVGHVSNRLVSLPSAALLVQIALMYIVSGLRKTGPAWMDGSAVYYALQIDAYDSAFVAWFSGLEALTEILTHGTRWLEVLGPILAFSPVARAPLRMLLIPAFVSFHLGHVALLSIGLFPAVCIGAWAVFLPSAFWDVWLPRIRGRPQATADAAPAFRPRAATQMAAALALAYVVWFLVPQVTPGSWSRVIAMPSAVTQVGRALRLNQYWAMFAPDAPRWRSWPVVIGILANSETIDPFRNAPVSWSRPLRDFYPSFRWRLYYDALLKKHPSRPEHNPLQRGMADYLCRRWNDQHGPEEALLGMEMGYLMARVHREREAPELTTGIQYRHVCAKPGLPAEARAGSRQPPT